MAKRRNPRPVTKRHFPRTARLNALLHEIVADYFEVVESEEIGFLTITGVEVDSDLNVAQIFVSVLGDDPSDDGDARILDALAEHRRPVQRAFAQQAKLRKTPEALFLFDPGVRAGARIDQILSTIEPRPDEPRPDEPLPAEPSDEEAE
jgi:ribosome-binding factor A